MAGEIYECIWLDGRKLWTGTADRIIKKQGTVSVELFSENGSGDNCIICVNDLLATQGVSLAVGINPITLLTTGSLGFGGVALLYAILACQFL